MQEQNLPTPVNPETPQQPVGGNGESVSPIPEVVASSPEHVNSSGDSVNQNAPAQIMQPVDLPQPITPATTPAVDEPIDAPAVADDVDVIEKVWVDKAKSIVKETRQDPYMQEKKVSGLQTEYQKKRYGAAETQ